jgi:hypothetical protein
MTYRNWTITSAYVGFVATHNDRFDGESHEWQVNGYSIEEVKDLIDEKEDD